MRYHILATDYDGTLAEDGRVGESTLQKLKLLRAAGRKLVLVTGREIKDLKVVFPDYLVCDYIVAENGAVIYEPATGREELLGPAPDAAFIQALKDGDVQPLSVGKVIVATWEPQEQAALKVIKAFGHERQLIFNKGAVMILPPGVNKATGLAALLRSCCLSWHNTVAVGDAQNDHALLQGAECAVAVQNAIPSLKAAADWVAAGESSQAVEDLIDQLIASDLSEIDCKLTRHFLDLGRLADGRPFAISPYRSGILLSGVSGGGKTTLSLSIIESLIRQHYQFCLIDPEGDYPELAGAIVIGDETTLPSMEEIRSLLKEPDQSVVICTVSIPLMDRPAFFYRFLSLFLDLRQRYGHPHWLLLDEAHHLCPASSHELNNLIPEGFNNFILISTSPHQFGRTILSKIGMVLTLGFDHRYPIEQFCRIMELSVPAIPTLVDGELCVWDREADEKSMFAVRYPLPRQFQQRHKKKYAQGDMGANSFIFTGPEHRLHLVANNLILFIHLAQGIDTETWLFHLHRKDYARWLNDSVHDEELADAAEEAEKRSGATASKKYLLEAIIRKYTG